MELKVLELNKRCGELNENIVRPQIFLVPYIKRTEQNTFYDTSQNYRLVHIFSDHKTAETQDAHINSAVIV